jgi:hypothetical protein
LGVRPAVVCRGTRLTPGPPAEPEEASGRLKAAESQIEPWFAPVRPETLCRMPRRTKEPELEVTDAEEDCSERPGAPRSLARSGE